MSTTLISDQLLALAGVMQQKGVSTERFQQILDSGLLADLFEPAADLSRREAVRAALKLGPPQPGGPKVVELPTADVVIEVDYAMTLEQMIAAGKYDWRNEDIVAKQFAIVGEGRIQFAARLFHFERSITSEDAEKAIREAAPTGQWEPGKIEHLLAFGAKYPDEQRKTPVVCLGSVSASKLFGKRCVPYLYRRVLGRSLHLDLYSNGWHSFYRFLGVRKLSPTV